MGRGVAVHLLLPSISWAGDAGGRLTGWSDAYRHSRIKIGKTKGGVALGSGYQYQPVSLEMIIWLLKGMGVWNIFPKGAGGAYQVFARFKMIPSQVTCQENA